MRILVATFYIRAYYISTFYPNHMQYVWESYPNIYLKILILEVTSSGLFQTHNAIILLPIKPLLQRFAHLAPWEAESIQEIAEEFQYLWPHWMCRSDGMCVFLCANIHIYLGTQMTRLCWLDFVPCFGGWKSLQNKRTFTGSRYIHKIPCSTLPFSLLWRHGGQGKVQGAREGFLEFSTFENGRKSQLLVPEKNILAKVESLKIHHQVFFAEYLLLMWWL